MRRRLYEVIEKSRGEDKASTVYDIFMIVIIIASLVPLAFKREPYAFVVMDRVAAGVFIVDYLLRWLTADYKLEKGPIVSFIRYPFTFMAIIDLVSILPSVSVISRGFTILRLLRMFRALRVLRIFKALRYSRTISIIMGVIRNSRRSLAAVGVLAGGYILIAALVIFNVEPDTFNSFFDAVYWATISLTTVGYGDIYPVSVIRRVFTMISSFLGIAVVAMPSGIITAGYMSEIAKDDHGDDASLDKRVSSVGFRMYYGPSEKGADGPFEG